MVGCVYRIIAKTTTLRIKKTMPSLIGESQSAFIKGMHILDGALVANEVIQWAKKSKKEVVLLNLDFQKAYDAISWKFLVHMLETMGFGSKWRGWINQCLFNASISVLVNGSPTTQFKTGR